MSYLRDQVVILKKDAFREHDRRYLMYGREHGLLHAVARGASAKTSKHAGHLEPFSIVEVMIAKGIAFDKLAVAHSVDGAATRRVASYLGSLAVLGAISDTIVKLTRPGISDVRIFDILIETRQAVLSFPSEPTPERARLLLAGATLKLLDVLGFAPPLETRTDVLPPALTLIKFLRRFPLPDALRVTTTTDVITEASSFVEDALRHTPLEQAPHGPRSIHALLDKIA